MIHFKISPGESQETKSLFSLGCIQISIYVTLSLRVPSGTDQCLLLPNGIRIFIFMEVLERWLLSSKHAVALGQGGV